MRVPFNTPYFCGIEYRYITEALENKQFSGDGLFTQKASSKLEQIFDAKKVLLTHSCTAALEMCALLLEITPGDEVIMPSFTFVSTANAFVLRGATPVFVDIDPLTQNIAIEAIECAISSKTRAIVVVHYAGISCDMEHLMKLANSYQIPVIEDAAQAIYSKYNGKPLGSFGDFATVSFHETKNITCGEGGALIINNSRFIERAEIIREKGTNRSAFFRGDVDKYTWVDVGSSYLPGEVSAAFLFAQLQDGLEITKQRMEKWDTYYQYFSSLDTSLIGSPMHIPKFSSHNAHMFYLVCSSLSRRSDFIGHMRSCGIGCVFHYVPLHSAPAGRRFGKVSGRMDNTLRAGNCLVRFPMGPYVDTQYVIKAISKYIG
ncbi:dTDP-4-amino-4,6-dideoxygalactose transaminase [Synechococcus sp. AH-736-M20]|nr:dTDP-4-amino-4,6-dideoxygalactose transaminase [Synechococcus sp. AH-736-M20]